MTPIIYMSNTDLPFNIFKHGEKMSDDPKKWTNQSIRAHLGEHGFIVTDSILQNNVLYTEFTRGEDSLTLVEYGDGPEPLVYQDGKQVDVTNIGYRNSQIQNKRGD